MRFLRYLGWWAFVCYTTFQLVQSWTGPDYVARQAMFYACLALLIVTDPYRKAQGVIGNPVDTREHQGTTRRGRVDELDSDDREGPPVQGDIQ